MLSTVLADSHSYEAGIEKVHKAAPADYRIRPDCWAVGRAILLAIQASWDNAQALLDLGVPPSQVQPALEAIVVMGCKYSCEMLKAYWRGPADASVPSPDAPNPAAVHLQALLS